MSFLKILLGELVSIIVSVLSISTFCTSVVALLAITNVLLTGNVQEHLLAGTYAAVALCIVFIIVIPIVAIRGWRKQEKEQEKASSEI